MADPVAPALEFAALLVLLLEDAAPPIMDSSKGS